MAGTTGVVALIVENMLYVANAGDSRCVLSRNGVAVEMSIDHKPDMPSEKARIENAGAVIIDGRVNGNINLSRSIGDLEYKEVTSLPPEQ
jgi:protein phosphatase 1G